VISLRPQAFGTWRWTLAAGSLAIQVLGCSSWRVQGPTPEAAIRSRQPSIVRLTRTDRTRLIVHHPTVRGDSLVGALSGSAPDTAAAVSLPLSEVQSVAVRRFHVLKSVGLYFAVGLAVTPIFWKWP
jgi:hypothetical protein